MSFVRDMERWLNLVSPNYSNDQFLDSIFFRSVTAKTNKRCLTILYTTAFLMIVIKRNPNSILIMSPNSLSSFSTVTSLLSYFLHLHPMFQYQNDYRSRHLIFPENSLLLITAFFNHRFYTTMLIMSPILIFFLEKIGVVT